MGNAGFNRIQLRLQAIGVQQFEVRGITTNLTSDLTLARERSLVRLQATEEGMQIDLAAEFVDVSVTAYEAADS